MFKTIPLWIALIALSMGCRAPLPQKVEVRGVWMHPPATREALTAAIDSLADAGINLIFLGTWYQSQTIYPSTVAAQHSAFKGWDPLRVALRQAHRRGIQVHAWMELLYAWDSSARPEYFGPVLDEHRDWLNVSNNPQSHASENGKLFFNPAHPEVQSFLKKLTVELAGKYKLDGIHLGYIRYPFADSVKAWGYDILSVRRMTEETGINPWFAPRSDSLRWRTFVDWKKGEIHKLMLALRDTVRAARPAMALSAAVVEDYQADPRREVSCQDWRLWVQGDVLDFVATLSYSARDSLQEREMARSVELARIPVILGFLNRGLESGEQITAAYAAAVGHSPAGVAWQADGWQEAAFFAVFRQRLYSEPARPFAGPLRPH